MRLTEGKETSMGVVEVKLEGFNLWKGIDSNGFGWNEANAVCKTMGFDKAAFSTDQGKFYRDISKD